MDTLVLFLILGGMLSVFTIKNNVCCMLIIYDLYYVEVCYFYAHFWRVLIIIVYWIFSKAFSASIEIIIWFLSFNLLMWCITLTDLQILKNPCIPGIKPTWSWCMIFLICCWILLARIFFKDFCIYVLQWYWPVVFFFFSFSSLIAAARTSKTMWIIVVKVETLVLFLILGGMLSVFTIESNVCCRLIIYGLYYV